MIIDMICVLRDKVENERLRQDIHLEIIELIEESRIIGSIKALKGVDPAFDAAYDVFEAKKNESN